MCSRSDDVKVVRIFLGMTNMYSIWGSIKCLPSETHTHTHTFFDSHIYVASLDLADANTKASIRPHIYSLHCTYHQLRNWTLAESLVAKAVLRALSFFPARRALWLLYLIAMRNGSRGELLLFFIANYT